MSLVVRHNPVIQNKMFALQNEPEMMLQYVSGLSNKDRRTVGYLLAEVFLPSLAEAQFWKVFLIFVSYDSKAYLGTFIKAIKTLYHSKSLSFDCWELKSFATDKATVIDRQKFLTEVLVLLRDPSEVKSLLDIFGVCSVDTRLVYLYRAGTSVCYYCLFNLLKIHDGDLSLLGKYCSLLLKKEDRLSKRVASLVNDYFCLNKDLPVGLKRLEPYKLGRLDGSYNSFKYIIDQI